MDAAAQVFAAHGLSAPTASISLAAGVAEGTLFTYFKTKDELLNALYVRVKVDLAKAMTAGLPRKKGVRARLESAWNQYVGWGVEQPALHAVLRQLEVWNGLTKESRVAGKVPFIELEKLIGEAEKRKIVRSLPRQFTEAALAALAGIVMELSRQDPGKAANYREAGFQMLWAGISRK